MLNKFTFGFFGQAAEEEKGQEEIEQSMWHPPAPISSNRASLLK